MNPSELREEVNKAKNFNPSLSHFTLAYTGPIDAVLQEEERKINQEHQNSELFKVKVMSWTEIKNLLFKHPSVFKDKYKELFEIFKEETTDSKQYLKLHLTKLLGELKKINFNNVLLDIHQWPVKDLELPNDIHQKLSAADRIRYQQIVNSISGIELKPRQSWLDEKEGRSHNLHRIKKQISDFIDEL